MKTHSDQPGRNESRVDTQQHVSRWLSTVALSTSDVDCANAVMLKILDGKCMVSYPEKQVIIELYHRLRGRVGLRLDPGLHALVAEVGGCPDAAMRDQIYEHGVLAESAIASPVMKAFKAMVRRTGLLETVDP